MEKCSDCMWEAEATHGIYDGKVPKNLRKQVQNTYENQHYDNHEKVA